MDINETPEEWMAQEAHSALGDLVGKDLALQMDQRFAYEAGDHQKGNEIRSRRAELALMILDAQAEYLRREIVSQEVHRKLMHEILNCQGGPELSGIRAGIDREIDKKIDTAKFQLEQTLERKKQALRSR